MIVLAWLGGVVVVVIALAAVYDHRARRRGLNPGPSAAVARRLSAGATGPSPDRGVSTSVDQDTWHSQQSGGG
jgi:hypothetical protein